MKRFLFLALFLIISVSAHADNIILMIGDGMGQNHIKCAHEIKPLYFVSLPTKGYIHTKSANSEVTDSAAAATAYACGQKTNNHFLGKLPNGKNCTTIAEEAVRNGISVGLYSTDHPTGATPSAFFAHTKNRYDKQKISKFKQRAKQTMDIAVPVKTISTQISPKLSKLSGTDANVFFAMFEEDNIDTFSHENNFEKMIEKLHDFDLAVTKSVEFAEKHPDTTVIVLADHETGGLTEECKFTTKQHTSADVSVYAYGKHAKLFDGEQDNTEIYQKIHQILFSK